MHPRLSQSHVQACDSFSLVVLAAGMAPASGDDTGYFGPPFPSGRRFVGLELEPPAHRSQCGALPYGRVPWLDG